MIEEPTPAVSSSPLSEILACEVDRELALVDAAIAAVEALRAASAEKDRRFAASRRCSA